MARMISGARRRRRLLNGWQNGSTWASLIWAGLIATIYIMVPWESMSGRPKFADLDNYLAAIELIASVPTPEGSSHVTWLLTEPGWSLLLLLIARFAEDPQQALLLISCMSATAFLWFMHRRAGAVLSLIIIFNPLVIDLLLSQVRSAFALGLLFTSLGCKNWIVKSTLALLACSVHSVSLVLLPCYFLGMWLQRSKVLQVRWLKGAICIGVALVLAWTLSYGREVLLSELGDRRAVYDVDPGSVMFVSFWMLWALAVIAVRSVFFRGLWHWSDSMVVILLSTAFFMTVFSTNGVRFVSLALPLVACNLNLIRGAPKMAGLVMLTTYQAIQFAYWY